MWSFRQPYKMRRNRLCASLCHFFFSIITIYRYIVHIRKGIYNVYTYIVLVRIKIGWPKKAGTFSSISEWVLMKFNVRSGNVRESLWHEPGRGSGTCLIFFCTRRKTTIYLTFNYACARRINYYMKVGRYTRYVPDIRYTGRNKNLIK